MRLVTLWYTDGWMDGWMDEEDWMTVSVDRWTAGDDFFWLYWSSTLFTDSSDGCGCVVEIWPKFSVRSVMQRLIIRHVGLTYVVTLLIGHVSWRDWTLCIQYVYIISSWTLDIIQKEEGYSLWPLQSLCISPRIQKLEMSISIIHAC